MNTSNILTFSGVSTLSLILVSWGLHALGVGIPAGVYVLLAIISFGIIQMSKPNMNFLQLQGAHGRVEKRLNETQGVLGRIKTEVARLEVALSGLTADLTADPHNTDLQGAVDNAQIELDNASALEANAQTNFDQAEADYRAALLLPDNELSKAQTFARLSIPGSVALATIIMSIITMFQ